MLALLLTSAAVFVVMTDDPILAVDDVFPEPVILDPERHPNFIFPEAARTSDLAVNRFVDRFARVCTTGKYSEFRLMLSRKHPPILPPRFESNFNAVKQVRVLSVDRLPPLPGANVPLAVLNVEYELEEFAAKSGVTTKQVRVAIVREDGELRIGPIPSDALAKLRAYQAHLAGQSDSARIEPAPSDNNKTNVEIPASQPAQAPGRPDDGGGAVTNRPLRIGS
ncbi:MAG: hypothetical protein DCC66_06945 [Planctomycetota bacterium]|nr:MAG: hypothetical protein DCC66_06945 [Planctomycetota bacterium]